MSSTTTTPTTDEIIASRRNELHKQRAARKDALDLPRTMTTRQINEYEAETAKIDKAIAAFNTTVETYMALPPLEPDERWRDFLIASRATLNAELLAIKAPIRDDVTRERARALGWSIELIDHGLGISKLGPIIDLSSNRQEFSWPRPATTSWASNGCAGRTGSGAACRTPRRASSR